MRTAAVPRMQVVRTGRFRKNNLQSRTSYAVKPHIFIGFQLWHALCVVKENGEMRSMEGIFAPALTLCTAHMRAAWYFCVAPILLLVMSPVSAARADVVCSAYASTYQNSFGRSSDVGTNSSSGATNCSIAAPGQTFPGTQYKTVLIDNSPTQFPFSLTGLIVDEASGTNGTLHAESSSAVDDTPESDFYTDQNGNPQSVPNPFPAGDWDTSTNVHYGDTLTVHNPTGDAVDLTFTLALDAPLSVSACPTGRVLLPYPLSGYSAPEPLIDASSSAGFGISYGAGYELYSMQDACDPASDMSDLTVDLSIPDGSVFGITGYLQTDAFISWGYQS